MIDSHFLRKGQCGYGDTVSRGIDPNQMGLYLPDVNLGDGFVVDSVSLGVAHSCAVSTNYTAKCFGSGENGALGIGDTTESNRGDEALEMGDYLPLLVFPSAFLPTQLSAGYQSSCAVSTDARVCCFGYGADGLTGQGNTTNNTLVFNGSTADLLKHLEQRGGGNGSD